MPLHNPCLLQALSLISFGLISNRPFLGYGSVSNRLNRKGSNSINSSTSRGIAAGVFHPIRPVLAVLQNELLCTLQKLSSPFPGVTSP